MSAPTNSGKDEPSLSCKKNSSLDRSIQDESIKEQAKLIEINNRQLEQDSDPMREKSTAKDVLTQSMQAPSKDGSSKNASTTSNEQVESSASGKMLGPDIQFNVRLLIKTNELRHIVQEDAVQKFGFQLMNGELAKSSYTSFQRVRLRESTCAQLILKKVQIDKFTQHNRDLLLDQGVRVMNCLCREGKPQSLCPYVTTIFDIFLLKEASNSLKESILYIFMESLGRSVNHLLRRVNKVKYKYVKRWTMQLLCVTSFLQNRAVAHRSLRLEHILLDSHQNIRITSWTRAVIVIDPETLEPVLQLKEPRIKRKNHLPSSVFTGPYDAYYPIPVDFWAVGYFVAVVSTKHFPFDPTNVSLTFQEQWSQFCQAHRPSLRDDMLDIMTRIFTFSSSNIDIGIIQGEVREILMRTALETESDELATDEDERIVAKFEDVMEDINSNSSDSDSPKERGTN